MKILQAPPEVSRECRRTRLAGGTVGLVPTMGFLHEGHLSLIRRARRENGMVVASIFINPAQFGPNEDLERYPRDLDRDKKMLEAEGVDLLFKPEPGDMYPKGYATYVEVEGITDRLCGAERPGHFKGVATVVAKLFNIVRPDRSYFGLKDYQQTAVIRRMVRDLNMDTEIITCPTVRESDGLAMSSRNNYLKPKERRAATVLIRALRKGEDAVRAGEDEAARVSDIVRRVIEEEPLVTDTDYVEITDPDTLRPVERISGPALLAVAARLGSVRLIDNILVSREGKQA